MWSSAFWGFLPPPSQGATGVSALNNCLLSVSKLLFYAGILTCLILTGPLFFQLFLLLLYKLAVNFVILLGKIVLLSWYQSPHIIIICWTYYLLTDLT